MDLSSRASAWLDRARLVVCVGSGGVGKTTTAAAIGLWAALNGKKVMVLTIDPAKRLANSLGLAAFGGAETRIDLTNLLASAQAGDPSLPAGPAVPGGELWAMMLDSRGTWDAVISRVAPSDEVRDRILQNRVFRVMSETFAGSQDYMATEKLHDLALSGRYDVVVLDTPPVKNALDFLESPGRLVNFLDEKVLEWFLAPYERKSIFGRLASGPAVMFFRLLAAVLGEEFLDDLTAFLRDFRELYAGFRQRHDEVLALFRAADTGFITVCAPTESSVEIAMFFQEELARRGLPRAGVVVNQVHSCAETSHDAAALLGPVAREIGADLGEKTVQTVLARLGMAHKRLHELAVAEAALVERVKRVSTGVVFYREVPRLQGEVHDLAALRQVGRSIFS